MAATPRRDPWDRRDNESDPAWEAFVAYRDLGLTRSNAQVAQRLGKSKTLIDRWSRNHSWVLRSAAWDRDQDKMWQRELAAARRKAAKRNVDLAEAMKNVAAGSLLKLAQSNEALKPADVARLMEVATKIEALEYGTPTERVSISSSDDAAASRAHVSQLSDEDRRARMEQLRRELDSRLTGDGEDVPA